MLLHYVESVYRQILYLLPQYTQELVMVIHDLISNTKVGLATNFKHVYNANAHTM